MKTLILTVFVATALFSRGQSQNGRELAHLSKQPSLLPPVTTVLARTASKPAQDSKDVQIKATMIGTNTLPKEAKPVGEAVVLPERKERHMFDEMDFGTDLAGNRRTAEDVYRYHWLVSKDSKTSFGPTVRSHYQISLSGPGKDTFAVGVFVQRKIGR